MLQEGHLLPDLLFSSTVLPRFPEQTNRLSLCFEESPKPGKKIGRSYNFFYLKMNFSKVKNHQSEI